MKSFMNHRFALAVLLSLLPVYSVSGDEDRAAEPKTAAEIQRQLGMLENNQPLCLEFQQKLKEGTVARKGKPLFPKIESA